MHTLVIPAPTGRSLCSTIERELLALLVRLGGLWLRDPSTIHNALGLFPIVRAHHSITCYTDHLSIRKRSSWSWQRSYSKNEVSGSSQAGWTSWISEHQAAIWIEAMCAAFQRERTSSWLSVLPLEEHGFYLQKGEFRDALCLRYVLKLNYTPQTCSCGTQFIVNHAMICHIGGFPTIRHNEIRDITASLLTEVCHVATEPQLSALWREHDSPVCKHWWWRSCRHLYKRLLERLSGRIFSCEGVLLQRVY